MLELFYEERKAKSLYEKGFLHLGKFEEGAYQVWPDLRDQTGRTADSNIPDEPTRKANPSESRRRKAMKSKAIQ